MRKFLKRIWDMCCSIDPTDPVYNCEIFLIEGCSHVDGALCNMDTCNILKEHHLKEIKKSIKNKLL